MTRTRRGLPAAKWIGLLYLCLASTPVGADTLEGRIVGVTDGDTVKLLDSMRTQHTIRLAGVDAPERMQPFGQRARQNLASLVFGKDVRVEWAKHDRYGRIVGKLWVESPDAPCRGNAKCPKTLDAGLAQITVGLAWWYRRYAKEQNPEDRGRYEHGEFEAKLRRVGLWSEKAPIAPWAWRRGGTQ